MSDKQRAEKPPVAWWKPILEPANTVGLYLPSAEAVLKEENKRRILHHAITSPDLSNQ